MSTCPTCGRPMPYATIGDELVRRMRNARAGGADCYQGRDGDYYITYGGGEVSREAIDDALKRGLIEPKWPDKDHQYWQIVGSA